jgi:hypothetical protein
MDARERLAIVERSRALAGGNGARAAAALVEEMVLSVPAAATPPKAVEWCAVAAPAAASASGRSDPQPIARGGPRAALTGAQRGARGGGSGAGCASLLCSSAIRRWAAASSASRSATVFELAPAAAPAA